MATVSQQETLRQLFAMGVDPLQKRNTIGGDFTKIDRHDTYEFINPKQFDMSGRTVLVTGASKGIGKAFAVEYAKAGVSIICLSARSSLAETEREVLEAAKAAGRAVPKVLRLTMDVTSQKEVEQAAKEVKDTFGGLDILVNNAGYIESDLPLLEVDPTDWWTTWQTNILGTFLVTRSFIPLLLSHSRPQPLKTIVTISSAWALTTFPENFGYQATKLAQLRLAEMITANFPPPTPAKTPGGKDDGLLSFSLHPGGVMTELGAKISGKMHWFLIDTPQLSGDTLVWLTAERREWLRDRYVSSQWDMEEVNGKREEILKNDLLKMRLSVGGAEQEDRTKTYMGRDTTA